MEKKIINNLSIEHAQIGFLNFGGKELKFNPAGRRNFCVFIPDMDTAEKLEEDGWRIRYLQPRDEADEVRPYMQVAVSFNNRPPKIVMIAGGHKTILTEDNVEILDYAEIDNVDLIVTPYNWEMNGKTGVKAYLKTMYVTIAEDEFANKYEDVPDSARGSYLDED